MIMIKKFGMTLGGLQQKILNADPTTLLSNMKDAVDEFVGDAPQFGDLTMLSVKYL